MATELGPGARAASSTRYCWLALLLIPFLAGGVVIGDEAWLLGAVHGLAGTSLSFADYARSADGWYISHHVLWFAVIFITSHITAVLHLSPLLSEVLLSCQTVMAGLAAIVVCYVFLVRRTSAGPWISAWTVLGFFAGGYGVYTFAMAGVVESYMALALAARLFLAERELDTSAAWKLTIVDAVLVGLKSYSLVFLVLTWPLLQGSRRAMRVYFFGMGAWLLVLFGIKRWLWNPYDSHLLSELYFSQAPLNFLQQFFSPWTGLLACLPVLWVLAWHRPSERKTLAYKVLGLCGCAAVFSLYDFYNGDIAGGRYIFPFVIALMPQIADATSRLLTRFPPAAWLLPLAVMAFIPVAGIRNPFFVRNTTIPNIGRCVPDHPVIRSWKTMFASFTGQSQVAVCYRNTNYVIRTADAASPRLGPWRVAYLLEGGYSPTYRAIAHDQIQKRHDVWGDRIAGELRTYGLGDPRFWQILGLIPALLALWLSLWAAVRINRSGPREAAA